MRESGYNAVIWIVVGAFFPPDSSTSDDIILIV